MFSKLFELNEKDVENFIKKEAEKRIGIPEPSKESFNIHYYPFNDEILVNIEPIGYWGDLVENGLTLKEYGEITSNHCHFTFQEIYGLITGETVYNCPYTIVGEKPIRGYSFIYHKEYAHVIPVDNTWKIIKWDEELEKEEYFDVPEDLMIKIKEILNEKEM